MSNIELFKNAFAVNFPVEVAELVLNRIADLHGAEFTKKYSGYEDSELTQLARTVLNGLNHADIARGITRMNSEEWCPSLPKFRSWCEQGGDWWTADMAWAKAMQFESANQEDGEIRVIENRYFANVKIIQNSTTRTENEKFECLQKLEDKYKRDLREARKPITTLAKKALDEVRNVLTAEGQKSAHFAFKDIYVDYLNRAKAKGMTQEMWVKPAEPKRVEDQVRKTGIPCPPELAAKIKRIGRVGGVA